MKAFLLSCLCLFFIFTPAFSQEETKTILLNKQEFQYLSSNELLVNEMIKAVFGISNKQNYYNLSITQVDAWTSKILQFKYYPGINGDLKKTQLNTSINNSTENTSLKLKVSLDLEKSFLTSTIKSYLNPQNALTLNLVIIGDPRVFASETKDKAHFFSTIEDQDFAESAFLAFFGQNPRKMNYNIVYKKTKACLVKNLNSPCTQEFDLDKSNPDYAVFTEKITSPEYSASFILFDLPIQRESSSLTADIEKMIIKEKDGSEHLKFYFAIPKDNARPKKKRLITIEGKILSGLRKPVRNLLVYLRDGINTVIASQKTDTTGYFNFNKLQEGGSYSIYVDNSCKEPELILVTKKDKFIGTLKKTDIGFEYKILDADIQWLTAKEEVDPSEDFLAVLKGRMVAVTDKIAPIHEQTIELKNSDNKLLQTKKTDGEGNFEFTGVDPEGNYSIVLPEYKPAPNEKIYLANSKNELITQFNKNSEGVFTYKIIAADLVYLSDKEVVDCELAFKKQKKQNPKEIVIHDFIYYDLNSFTITNESAITLEKIVKIASENKAYKLEIISHTDCIGDQQDNLKLSQKRSESVAAFLVSKKIDATRLKSLGVGESKPLNSCVDGKSCIEPELKMNRRTEFKFYQ